MPENNTDEAGEGALSEISRRRVLATTSGAVVGTAAIAGTTSAHEVDTIAFCGCSQVTVYGIELLSEGTDYEAVVYCDGSTQRRPLTGTETRQNYDVHADEEVDGDCQIIAVTGTTYPEGTFTICNEHCPSNCAARGLEDAGLECDDPDEIETNEFDSVTVQCSGCGRDEPGNPGQGGGNGNQGQGGGNGNQGKGGGNGNQGRGRGRN